MIYSRPKLETENSKEYAYDVLLNEIISGELRPGYKLLETMLCTKMNLSRTPIREAEIELEQVGMIEICSKRGTYVSKINTFIATQAMELRKCVEVEVIRELAVKGISDEDYQAIKEIIDQWKEVIDDRKYHDIYRLDLVFHEKLYALAGREFWFEKISRIFPQIYRVALLSFASDLSDLRWMEHLNILEAVYKKDADLAVKLTIEHALSGSQCIPELKKIFPKYFEN